MKMLETMFVCYASRRLSPRIMHKDVAIDSCFLSFTTDQKKTCAGTLALQGKSLNELQQRLLFEIFEPHSTIYSRCGYKNTRTWLFHMPRIVLFFGCGSLPESFIMRASGLSKAYSLTMISFSVLAVTCRQFTVGELLPPQLPRPPTHGHARPQQLEGLDLGSRGCLLNGSC